MFDCLSRLLFDCWNWCAYQFSLYEKIGDAYMIYDYVKKCYYSVVITEEYDLSEDCILERGYYTGINKTKYTYCIDGRLYIIVYHGDKILTDNEIKELLEQEYADMELLSAELDDVDFLETLNKYHGPTGDFHKNITGYPLLVRGLSIDNFDLLTYIDGMGDIIVKTEMDDEL